MRRMPAAVCSNRAITALAGSLLSLASFSDCGSAHAAEVPSTAPAPVLLPQTPLLQIQCPAIGEELRLVRAQDRLAFELSKDAQTAWEKPRQVRAGALTAELAIVAAPHEGGPTLQVQAKDEQGRDLLIIKYQAGDTKLEITRTWHPTETRTEWTTYTQTAYSRQQQEIQLYAAASERFANGAYDHHIGCWIKAHDFQELTERNHPEIERYLRPVLRELGQLQLLPDPCGPTAQLLKHRLPITAADLQRFGRLVEKLDADDWRSRDEAQKEILDAGPRGALYVLSMNRAGLSPEQGQRIDGLHAQFGLASEAELKSIAADPFFWINRLADPDALVRLAAAAQLPAFKIDRNELAKEPAGDQLLDQLREQAFVAVRGTESRPRFEPQLEPRER